MKNIILTLAHIVNNIHDIIVRIVGDSMTDKQLHFWVMGFIGIFLFSIVYVLFKLIAHFKWSVGVLSFLYTGTIMLVLVFAIELQQALTNRGNMEFQDAVVGMWGFLVFFGILMIIVAIFFRIKKLF